MHDDIRGRLRELAQEAGADLHIVDRAPSGTVTHAEIHIAHYASDEGITLRGMAASNHICTDCTEQIQREVRQLHPEIEFDSPQRRE
jgi:hypothetical protein